MIVFKNIKYSFVFVFLALLAACQNRLVDSNPQLGAERNELMKRVEVAKAQVQANEEIVDVFEQVRVGVRQIGSLFGTDSSTYTPFDTVKNIFEDFGGGIPAIEDKNQYILRKSISIPNGFENCNEFEVYSMLVDQKADEQSLEIEGQTLSYAIKGCDIKERTKLLDLEWSNEGIFFSIESETIRRLTNIQNYESDIRKSLQEEVVELAANMECQTAGRIFESFKFSCQNIVINVHESDVSSSYYAHSVLLSNIVYNSEAYIRFEAEGVNIVRYSNGFDGNEEGRASRIEKESLYVKVYEDGAIDHQLTPFIDAIKDNPEVSERVDDLEGLTESVSEEVDELRERVND